MGVVFRASDPELGREVAIKVLLPSVGTAVARDRLLSEARAMAKLRHPAVVPVFDVGTTDHGVFIAMPFVEGGTLHDWLHEEPRSWSEVTERFLAAGRGLAAAHAAGLVHRDFKPRNVLLDRDGGVLVADFGIASLSSGTSDSVVGEQSSVAGTPAYMAPEQARGEAVDARADQFSFSVSFWEGLYGERPDSAETATRGPRALFRAGRISASNPAAAVPRWLRGVLLRGLAFQPSRRWRSMDEFIEAIESRIRPERTRTTRRRIASVGLLTVGSLLGGGLLLWRQRSHAPGSVPAVLSSPQKITQSGGCAEDATFIDNEEIVFDVTRGPDVDLFALKLGGGAPRRLTDDKEWEWRPRPGRRPGEILYLGTIPSDMSKSYLAALDAGTAKAIWRQQVLAAGISSVGDLVYYSDINGSELRMLKGTEDKLIHTYDPGALATFAIDPRSMRIAYVGPRGGHLCHHLLSSPTPVCSSFKTRTHTPAFSRDGDAIYVGSPDGVHRLDVTTGAESTILDVDASGGVAISPNGKQLVYSSCRASGNIVDVTASPEKVLVQDPGARSPALGAEGRLAWIRSDGLNRVLMVRGPDGSVQQITSPTLGDVRDPAFGPEGKHLAFAVTGKKPGVYIATLDASRVVVTRFTEDKGDREPVWFSPDGIAFERRAKEGMSTTHLIKVSTGETSVVAAPSSVCLTGSPTSGELLVLSQAGAGAGLRWLDPVSGKMREGPKGGPSVLTSAAISPNGAWLLLEGGAAGSMWRARLPDGELELVHEEAGVRTATESTIDNDGHVIAAPVEWKGDLFSVSARSGTL